MPACLDAWLEVATVFARLTPGRQRGIAFRIDGAKRAEARLQRAIHELKQLARMVWSGGPATCWGAAGGYPAVNSIFVLNLPP